MTRFFIFNWMYFYNNYYFLNFCKRYCMSIHKEIALYWQWKPSKSRFGQTREMLTFWLDRWRDNIKVLKNVLRISKIPHRHSKPFMRFKGTCVLIHRILISWSWLSTYSGALHLDLILSQCRFLGILSSIHNFRTVI